MAATSQGAGSGSRPGTREHRPWLGGRPWRLAGQAAVALLVLGLLWFLWAAWDHQAVLHWMRTARPLPFFLAMALLPAVGVPISPLFILAGAMFGAPLALLGSAAALAANLSLCYSLARLLRPKVESLLRRFGEELPVLTGARQSPLRFTAAVRVTPGPPQAIKSYGLGVAGVPFAPYLAISMAITGTYAVLLIVLGESILEHDLSRTAIVVGGLAVLAVGITLWRRRRSRRAADGPELVTA